MTTLRKVNFIPVGNEIELAKKWKFNSDHHNCVLEAGSIIKITKVSLYGYHRVHFRCKYSTDGERPKGVFRISLEDANKIYYFENKKVENKIKTMNTLLSKSCRRNKNVSIFSGSPGTGKTTFTLYNDSESTYTYNDDNYMATGSGKSKTHKSKTRYNPGKALFSEKYMNNIITSSGDMAKIGYKAGTDKITHHGYHRFYPRFIEHLRSREKSGGRAMLEIGIQKSLSLSMWLNYFPYAYIYGIDIGVEDSGDRYTIFKAD